MNELSLIETLVIFLMIFFIMLGIGSSISFGDIKDALGLKKQIFLGLLLQYMLLPLIALTLGRVFELAPNYQLILLFISCCPGGITSNLFTYINSGLLTLSVLITSFTTIFAWFMTPFLFSFFSNSISNDIAIFVDFLSLIKTLLLSMVPIIVGFVVNLKWQKSALKLQRISKVMAYICIIIMVLIWIPRLIETFQQFDRNILLSLFLLSFLGIIVACLFARLLRSSKAESITLGFETGIQNAPLAFAILSLSFPASLRLELAFVPLVYGAFSVFSASFATILLKIFFKPQ
jgi:BASS family bile acid:Na+ symporter